MTEYLPKKWASFNKEEISENKFEDISNRTEPPNKPFGGFWASPIINRNNFISTWDRWCIANNSERYLGSSYIEFTLNSSSNVYIIDSYSDLETLYNKFGTSRSIFDSIESTPFKNSILTNYKNLNFESIAKIYQGIYLTNNGLSQTTTSSSSKYNLWGWDCESIVIFDIDCIDSWSSRSFSWDY